LAQAQSKAAQMLTRFKPCQAPLSVVSELGLLCLSALTCACGLLIELREPVVGAVQRRSVAQAAGDSQRRPDERPARWIPY
jgi:hypothetical protein